MIALGFATPQYVEDLMQANKQNSSDNRYRDFREQEDLKIVITAVCDIFDVHAEEAIAAGANINREGLNSQYGVTPKDTATIATCCRRRCGCSRSLPLPTTGTETWHSMPPAPASTSIWRNL